MWTKICGVQKTKNAKKLAQMKINALGINRYEPSSRFVERDRARSLAETIESTNPEVMVVGVFVNEGIDFLREELDTVPYDALQLHGDESPKLVSELSDLTHTIKAFQVSESDTSAILDPYDPWAFLLDAYHPEKYGGTGETGPWKKIREWTRDNRIILAGGLGPENVTDAIETVEPWGIDACSGVEDEKGFKDLVKVRSMIEAISGIELKE